MYRQLLEAHLKEVIRELGFVTLSDTLLSIPENSKFGDYSSNVALQLAKQKTENSYHSSLDIANTILEKFGHPHYLERVEIAGPGFLNFYIKTESLVKGLGESGKGKVVKTKYPKRILVEFAHPNTHKAFHIGHLRNVTLGESISRLLSFTGNEIFRVTYGGDIGPHVAKAIWGILKLKDEYEQVKLKSLRERAEFLGKAYAKGSASYDSEEKVKEEIDELNKRLYEGDPQIKPVWEETKEWSIGYFDSIYLRVGTIFDAQIWESEVQETGSLTVEENLGKVFEKDEGAIIFRGEKYGLHNRVFITSKGYPTYEAKELGLTRCEQELFPYDLSLHVVASEQAGFFEVTTKALEVIDPSFVGKKKHLSYGMVNLSTGKMSSRKGEVITTEALIDQVKAVIEEKFPGKVSDLDKLAISAIKFYFLKYSINSDIAYDVEKSVSLHGDSGPYVQYAYARISSLLNRAILRQAQDKPSSIKDEAEEKEIAQRISEEEREVLRQLEFFESYALLAANKFQPNELTNYLLNLTRAFNLFYERYPIIGSEHQDFRMEIAKKVGEVLKLGLYLLGIEVVERM